jgi:beta-glucanase (GH16 family)
VTFDLGGNPDRYYSPAVKTIQVSAGDESAQFQCDTQHQDWYWASHSWSFTADSTQTAIQFASTSGSGYNRAGPALDNVSVSAVIVAMPDIQVSPFIYDFGDVEIGLSETMIISISNTGDADLSIDTLEFQTNSTIDFLITSAPFLPAVIPPSGVIDFEVAFTPSAEYLVEAVLQIASNDPDEPLVEINIAGVGVVDESTPDEQIEEILDFIDDSLADGSLIGEGSGNSAGKRLNALINMINAAGDLIRDGLYAQAIEQLKSAHKKCDGQSPPPDFVSGSAVQELSSYIQNLIEFLYDVPAYMGFIDDFDDFWPNLISQNNIWQKSNWDVNDLNTHFAQELVDVQNGKLFLTVDAKTEYSSTLGRDLFRGAEISTVSENYRFGWYEASIKAASEPGVVNGFFIYDPASLDEIDVEILTEDFGPSFGEVHFVLHPKGIKGKEDLDYVVQLNFNPSADFNSYAFRWSVDKVEFYVNENYVGYLPTYYGSEILSEPGKIFFNNWTGANVNWGGGPPANSAQMEVAWIKFVPEN